MTDSSHNPKKYLTNCRISAILTGLLLVLLGILFFFSPLGAMLFADIFITIGLLIYGIYLIITFLVTPKGYRDMWQLAASIILIVCAVVVLASSASSVIVSFAIILGIVAMMVGINQIIGYVSLRGIPSAGFILASGIINVLLALFLIIAPFVTTAAIGIVQGVYLCIAGIALIIEGFAKHPLSLD